MGKIKGENPFNYSFIIPSCTGRAMYQTGQTPDRSFFFKEV